MVTVNLLKSPFRASLAGAYGLARPPGGTEVWHWDSQLRPLLKLSVYHTSGSAWCMVYKRGPVRVEFN
jgi:hypothetical protein